MRVLFDFAVIHVGLVVLDLKNHVLTGGLRAVVDGKGTGAFLHEQYARVMVNASPPTFQRIVFEHQLVTVVGVEVQRVFFVVSHVIAGQSYGHAIERGAKTEKAVDDQGRRIVQSSFQTAIDGFSRDGLPQVLRPDRRQAVFDCESAPCGAI